MSMSINVDSILEKLNSEIETEKEGLEKTAALARMKEIAKVYKGEDQIVSFKELEEDIKNAPPIAKIPSKIEALDKLLYGGFMTQTVTTISATPKSGKTSFCMYLTTKMPQYNPLWLALEESAKSLIRKMIKNGEPAPHGFSTKNNPTITMEWIESKIVESIAKYDTKVVFIDQLDFIVPQDNADRHDLKIAHTMRVLHQLAVKWDVAIFIICHLEKMEPTQKPTTKNLRGSSAIWGEADNCIFLWRECSVEKGGEVTYTNNILVSLQANREDGDTGNIQMVYEAGKFREQQWETPAAIALKEF